VPLGHTLAVGKRIEELDWRATPMGEISLRRRVEPSLGVDVFEVKLGQEFLMSSLFTVAESELARLGLAALPGADLDVVVGGLGLGYTARAALADPRVRSVHVVEALEAVVSWHQDDLLPLAQELTADPRCAILTADFFAMVASAEGFGPTVPQPLHAVLLDVDHTPRHVLHPSHAGFYEPAGMQRVAERLHPAGVFALWSDDPPEDHFLRVLADVFATVDAHVVRFTNPLTGGESSNTVYVATTSPTPSGMPGGHVGTTPRTTETGIDMTHGPDDQDSSATDSANAADEGDSSGKMFGTPDVKGNPPSLDDEENVVVSGGGVARPSEDSGAS